MHENLKEKRLVFSQTVANLYNHQSTVRTLWKMVWPKPQQSVVLQATLGVVFWLILSGVACQATSSVA